MKIRALLFACLIPIALSTSACEVSVSGATSESTFDRTLAVTGPVELEVHTGSGDIQVRVGTGRTVQVHGRVTAGFGSWANLDGSAADRVREIAANPPIEQSGNVIRLGPQKGGGIWNNVSISYEVTVPANTKLTSGSGSGDQVIGDVTGPVAASSGSGDIRIGQTSEDVNAHTGSGDIELQGARSVVAHTGSGTVKASAIGGDVEVDTGSGDVAVSQRAPGRVRVRTGSGSITVMDAQGELRVRAASGNVSVRGTPSAPWELGAASGDVTIQVTGTAGFDLDARTSSGDIESAFPITMSGSLSRRHELHGQVRGGGPRLEVSTASGDIRIR